MSVTFILIVRVSVADLLDAPFVDVAPHCSAAKVCTFSSGPCAMVLRSPGRFYHAVVAKTLKMQFLDENGTEKCCAQIVQTGQS